MNGQANFLRGGIIAEATIFDDATDIYSLRKYFNNWNNSILKLRRSSDDTEKYIFFDGDIITLNSLVGDSSSIKSTTTLADWIGSDNAYVSIWFSQNNTNTIDRFITQISFSVQPLFISLGIINTENSKPAIYFNGSNVLDAVARTELDYGNDFTIIALTSHKVLGGFGYLFNNGVSTNSLFIYNDNRTAKRIAIIFNPTIYGTFYLTQQNKTSNKLLTNIYNTGFIKSYYDNIFQTNVTYSGTYSNSIFRVGGYALNGLIGNMQEFIIFPTDKTTDLSTLHTDINNYYSIY